MARVREREIRYRIGGRARARRESVRRRGGRDMLCWFEAWWWWAIVGCLRGFVEVSMLVDMLSSWSWGSS